MSRMTEYLEVNCNIIDHYVDEQVVEWYSVNFGRSHEAKHGPFIVVYQSALDPEGKCQ